LSESQNGDGTFKCDNHSRTEGEPSHCNLCGSNAKRSVYNYILLKNYIFAKVLWTDVEKENACAFPRSARSGFTEVVRIWIFY